MQVHRSTTPRLCATCGKPFQALTQNVRLGRGIYCSRSCIQPPPSRKVLHTCAHCGKEFAVYPSRSALGFGLYCSRDCRLESEKPDTADRFWSNVIKTDTCWIWKAGQDQDGYGTTRAANKKTRAHRLAWQLANGQPPPADLLVLHRCDNPSCVRPDHLFLGTNRENMQDAAEKGRLPRGERQHLAKLTEPEVRCVRDRYAAGGITQRRLAAEYGVNPTVISAIVCRKTWKHLP